MRELAKTGYTKQGIAFRLGCGLDVFNRWLSESAELQDAFNEGRETEHNALYTAVFDAAMKGNIVAALFLLKARHGYREGDQSRDANTVNVTFNLPGAMQLQDFLTIDERNDQPQPLPATRPPIARRA